MTHDIPAKSKLVPAIPITSPQFVYRRARETDVRRTFDRVRAGIESAGSKLADLRARVGHPDGEVPDAAMAQGQSRDAIWGQT